MIKTKEYYEYIITNCNYMLKIRTIQINKAEILNLLSIAKKFKTNNTILFQIIEKVIEIHYNYKNENKFDLKYVFQRTINPETDCN